ncbi:MAG: endonuclease domain-containing protein [Patescibacteria group bacterium]
MKFHFNSPILKNRRKQLRSNSTETESIFWQKLRNDKLGFKFFRQYSIDGYVVDFYCPKKRLAIEIDGGYHQKLDVKKYDSYRTRYFDAYNIKTIRFWNSDVKNNIEKVLADIKELLASPS